MTRLPRRRASGQTSAAGTAAGAGAAQETQGGRPLQIGAPPAQTLDTMLSVNVYKGELARWLWCLTRSSLNSSDSQSTLKKTCHYFRRNSNSSHKNGTHKIEPLQILATGILGQPPTLPKKKGSSCHYRTCSVFWDEKLTNSGPAFSQPCVLLTPPARRSQKSCSKGVWRVPGWHGCPAWGYPLLLHGRASGANARGG